MNYQAIQSDIQRINDQVFQNLLNGSLEIGGEDGQEKAKEEVLTNMCSEKIHQFQESLKSMLILG